MDKNSVCPICGEPTYLVYGKHPRKDGLCAEHSRMLYNKEIEQCPDCGKWHETDKPCECKTPKKVEKVAETNSDSELTCIICGEPSNGKHFCRSCYYKYKNKDIFLKIKKCEFPCGDPISEFYDGIYECADGHIVKSMAEQSIDDYLCDNGILHGYELPLDIGTEKPLKPDFCLINYLGKDNHVYIEYFGLKGDPDYDKTTAYKINFYKKLGITLICMYPKTDQKNIRFALNKKLNKEKLKVGELNYYEE